MASPAPPTNVTPTVDSNDQITLTWDHDPTWFAFDGNDGSLGGFDEGMWYSSDAIDHFEIELSRDSIGYKDPNGGPSSVTHDGKTSYSGVYGPDSQSAYETVVGSGSMFKFRVRSVNADGKSSWATTTKAYTDLYLPSSLGLTTSSSSSATVSWTNEDDNTDGFKIHYREVGGSTWNQFSNISSTETSETVTGLTQDTDYEVYIEAYTGYVNNDTGSVSSTTYLNELRSTTSHSSSASTSNLTIVTLAESISSYGKSSSSGSIRVVNLVEGVTSSSHAGSAAVSTVITLTENVSSYSDSASSNSIGVIDVGYGVGSHGSTASSSTLRVTDVLANPSSHFAASNSTNSRNGVTFARNSDASYSTTASSLSNRLVDLLALPASHLGVSNSDSSRLVSLFGDVNSFSKAGSTATSTVINLGEEVSSHANPSSSNSIGVIDVSYGVDSHGRADDSSALRVTDVLANPSSHFAASNSTNSRNGVAFDRNSDASYSTTASSLSDRLVDLLALPASHLGVSNSDSSRLVSLKSIPQSHSADLTSSVLRVVDLLETVSTYSSPASSSVSAVIDMLAESESYLSASTTTSGRSNLIYAGRAPGSNVPAIDTESIRVIDLLETVSSHSSAADSTVSVLIDMLAAPMSGLSTSSSSSRRDRVNYAGRAGASTLPAIDTESIRVIDLLESVESHSIQMRSSIYNDRTSLELLDQNITWSDDESVWYTDWLKETKILESEDSLAVRSLVIENAKEPAATVILQQDQTGDGKIDHESEPVRLGQNQSVEKFEGVPVDESAYYRLRISEYSGYNSLYAIDTAITH